MAKRKQIILDFSANTFKNDPAIIDRAVREISEVDTKKHEIIFKTQLFVKAGDNIPCEHKMYDYLHTVCAKKGYKCTASVFDNESLEFLYDYHKKRKAEGKQGIPFIKIANNPDLARLSKYIPRGMKVYASISKYLPEEMDNSYLRGDRFLRCVSEYPAKNEDYEKIINALIAFRDMNHLKGDPLVDVNISDHTVGLNLYKKYEKDIRIWEKHLILDDSTGLDAGPFAITPKELAEIL